MIDGLKPYTSMKPTDCAWLGDIPSHWSTRRNGGLFAQRTEFGIPDLPILEVSIKTGVRARATDGTGRKQTMSDHGKYKCARRGDIAYNTMRMWQGAVGVAPMDGLISPAYVVVRPNKNVIAGYYASLFRTPMFMKEVIDCSRGIVMDRNRLYWDQFKQISVPVTDQEEQTAIIRYLHHATREVDRALRNHRSLIGLLNEQRKAAITQVLGLQNATPSNLPGGCSSGWSWIPLKHICSIQTGITLGNTTRFDGLIEYPYLRVANVQAGRLNLRSVKTLKVPASIAKRSTLEVGDVLMTEGGDPDKLGRGCVWRGEIPNCLHQNHIFAVRVNEAKITPGYLALFLEASYSRRYFEQTAKQTTNLASTNQSTIGRLRVLVPSVQDQRRIVAALRNEMEPIDASIASQEKTIALLSEYRNRLIADIVTGKLDVRAAAASLPADVDEPLSVAIDIDGDDQDTDEESDA